MLSSRAKYALRACVDLARRHEPGKWTLTSEIAAVEEIPRKFLEAILVELRDNGILESGGYRLKRQPHRIAASEIIRIADGPLALAPCASKTQFGPCADCPDITACPLCPMLRRARDAVADVLDGYSLATLVDSRGKNSLRRVEPARRSFASGKAPSLQSRR